MAFFYFFGLIDLVYLYVGGVALFGSQLLFDSLELGETFDLTIHLPDALEFTLGFWLAVLIIVVPFKWYFIRLSCRKLNHPDPTAGILVFDLVLLLLLVGFLLFLWVNGYWNGFTWGPLWGWTGKSFSWSVGVLGVVYAVYIFFEFNSDDDSPNNKK
jgi:hypothetical protein